MLQNRFQDLHLESHYERFEDGTNTLFGKDASVQLKSLKVYHGVYEEVAMSKLLFERF